MKSFNTLIAILSFTASVLSQQVTTTNAAGNTIVEQVTTNALGQTITQILQTLGGAATTSASQTAQTLSTAATTAATTSPTTTATTTAAAVQGPVGQPASTPLTPGGPTPYTYTTTDANGNPVIGTATFTPSFPATTPYTPSGTGTVLGYSQWLSIIGNNTSGLSRPVASQEANSASRAGVQLGLSLGLVLITIMGLLGGSL
ncbi:hypothetical protein F5888DRAFT_1672548 [Russula emetica]|nr:hypothetical protein F5888DRAFT_1672548 [Russula emetica]